MKRNKRAELLDRVRVEDFTPIQKRMYAILLDGESHTKEELHTCVDDELSELKAINHHLEIIRKAVSRRGLVLKCVINGGRSGQIRHYQLFRRLSKDN